VLSLCREKDILHEEISSLELMNDRLKTRIAELEDSVCRTREAFSRKSDDVGTSTSVEV